MGWRIRAAGGGGRVGAVARRVAGTVRRRVEIDSRALAAFRIALGALLIADLALRSRNLVAFYTDRGVLPRDALFADYSPLYSIHALWGEAWVQAVLFLLAGLFGLAMVVGYRTRLATVASWVLLVSLHIRNPMVLNGGDSLFRMLLFWAMFLPLGARWSVDAVQRDNERVRRSVASVGTAALLGQMVLLYVTNALHKSRGEQWLNGEAVVYVFSLDQFTVLLGNILAEYYGLLRIFTYMWIALVILSPLLLVSAGKGRTLLATLFIGMHLGMLVTMQIGLFPLVVVAGLLPFYPSAVWDSVETGASRIGLMSRLRRWRTAVVEATPESPIRRVQSAVAGAGGAAQSGALDRLRNAVGQVVPLFFLALVVLSNAQAVDMAEVPDTGQDVLETIEADQHWRMFAPDPLSTDGWYVVPGELTNGSEADILSGGSVEWDRPPNLDATYATARWRKYLRNVWSSGNRNHETYFGNYLCDRWNRTHESGVTDLGLYYMSQPSEPYNGTESVDRNRFHMHDCAGGRGR